MLSWKVTFSALNTSAETKAAIFHRTWYASGAGPSSLIDKVQVALTRNLVCGYTSTRALDQAAEKYTSRGQDHS